LEECVKFCTTKMNNQFAMVYVTNISTNGFFLLCDVIIGPLLAVVQTLCIFVSLVTCLIYVFVNAQKIRSEI